MSTSFVRRVIGNLWELRVEFEKDQSIWQPKVDGKMKWNVKLHSTHTINSPFPGKRAFNVKRQPCALMFYQSTLTPTSRFSDGGKSIKNHLNEHFRHLDKFSDWKWQNDVAGLAHESIKSLPEHKRSVYVIELYFIHCTKSIAAWKANRKTCFDSLFHLRASCNLMTIQTRINF